MPLIRLSNETDIPALRELWALAFGDAGAYVDNFFRAYYRPERVFVLEEDGLVRSMTTWFDSTFVVPGRGEYPAAYLYAVATHPDCRGKGYAAQVLAWGADWLRDRGFAALTTVPSEPSLHRYYASLGFREQFTHTERQAPLAPPPGGARPALRRLSPADYVALRETLLAGTAHIRMGTAAAVYQAGCCALTPGGGLYAVEAPGRPAILCAEGQEDGRLLVKELLGSEASVDYALAWLPALLPDWSGRWRTLGNVTKFGMVKWLGPQSGPGQSGRATAFLGLAFD